MVSKASQPRSLGGLAGAGLGAAWAFWSAASARDTLSTMVMVQSLALVVLASGATSYVSTPSDQSTPTSSKSAAPTDLDQTDPPKAGEFLSS